MRPLEACLQLAADAPVGVTEVIVDRGVFRLQVDGALEVLDRLIVIADAVVSPAERIDDIAVMNIKMIKMNYFLTFLMLTNLRH